MTIAVIGLMMAIPHLLIGAVRQTSYRNLVRSDTPSQKMAPSGRDHREMEAVAVHQAG
jgi:hypothetical protein